MPYGSSYIDYSLTLQFLCVKSFGNIFMKKSQSYSVCKRQSSSFLSVSVQRNVHISELCPSSHKSKCLHLYRQNTQYIFQRQFKSFCDYFRRQYALQNTNRFFYPFLPTTCQRFFPYNLTSIF